MYFNYKCIIYLYTMYFLHNIFKLKDVLEYPISLNTFLIFYSKRT